jgi:hypothetical protein
LFFISLFERKEDLVAIRLHDPNKKKKSRGRSGKPVDPVRQKKMEKLERDYYRDLHRLVNVLFEAACERDWTWHRFAQEACVAPATVNNLGYRQTQKPQLYTIWRLACAVDMEFELTEVEKRHSAVAKKKKKRAA